MLGLTCKGAAILEINKETMKTDNIRKLVWTNYVTNVYKNRDCPESVAVSCEKKKKKFSQRMFLTVSREIGNITFFFRPHKKFCEFLVTHQMVCWHCHLSQ